MAVDHQVISMHVTSTIKRSNNMVKNKRHNGGESTIGIDTDTHPR